MIYIYSIGDNMKLQQLREIILNCKYVVEVHENDFKVMNDYVRINDIITLHDITRIDIVGADETDDIDGVNVLPSLLNDILDGAIDVGKAFVLIVIVFDSVHKLLSVLCILVFIVYEVLGVKPVKL